jgi:hypothetical protein
MIELGKVFARIGSGGVGGASRGLFQRSDGRRLMMTLTDELFLPTRIVYRWSSLPVICWTAARCMSMCDRLCAFAKRWSSSTGISLAPAREPERPTSHDFGC